MNGRKSRIRRTVAHAGSYLKRGEVRCTVSHTGLRRGQPCPACGAVV